MARCKECIHYVVCAKEGRLVQIDEHTWDDYNQLDDVEHFCDKYLAHADVVPKSEVEHWKEEANRYQNLWCKTCNDFEISEMIAEAKTKMVGKFVPKDGVQLTIDDVEETI